MCFSVGASVPLLRSFGILLGAWFYKDWVPGGTETAKGARSCRSGSQKNLSAIFASTFAPFAFKQLLGKSFRLREPRLPATAV